MQMRLASTLLAALPLLAACEPDPFAAPTAPTIAIRTFSYRAPVVGERYVAAPANAEPRAVEGPSHVAWLEKPAETFTAVHTSSRRGNVAN